MPSRFLGFIAVLCLGATAADAAVLHRPARNGSSTERPAALIDRAAQWLSSLMDQLEIKKPSAPTELPSAGCEMDPDGCSGTGTGSIGRRS